VAFSLELPDPLGSEGWKVKIRDKERLEPPHVTIFRKREEWRLGLRDGVFLVPPGGSLNDIDERVRDVIEANWQRLCGEWDRMYPTNRVSVVEEENDG
jgi:hypothetical protein